MDRFKFRLFSQRHWMLWVKAINIKTKVASCYKSEWDYIPQFYDGEYKEAELMQRTWLKDSKGKDIYEGDIVKYTAPDNYLEPSFISPIVWSDIYAGWAYKKTSQIFEDINEFEVPFWEHTEPEYNIYPYIEIIWNIYENPDLLPKPTNG